MTDTPADSFDALLQKHRGIVQKVAGTYAHGPEDRADLVQEIAVQLWRAWPVYDPARRFSTWMYRIALNTGISWLRSQSRRTRHMVPLDEHRDIVAEDGRMDPEAQDRIRILEDFMGVLGPLDRALLLLYLEERSGAEMAEVLGIGESNVTTRIGRLKQRLRDFARPPATKGQDNGCDHGTR